MSARYAPCLAPDTLTASGVPACSAPVWGASRDFTGGGIRFNGSSSSEPFVAGTFADLSGASPLCANGTYAISTVLRVTGPVCAGARCTLMDTPAVVTLDAVDGEFPDEVSLASSGLASSFESIEILEASVSDPLGEQIASPAVTNAFRLSHPAVVAALRDLASPTDDRLILRGILPSPPLDPTVGGATFTVTDQNGTIYSVTIPASAWQVVSPGKKWRYEDEAATLGGVRVAVITRRTEGFAVRLNARDVSLSAADLPSVNFVATVSNSGSGTSIGMRDTACRRTSTRLRCRVRD